MTVIQGHKNINMAQYVIQSMYNFWISYELSTIFIKNDIIKDIKREFRGRDSILLFAVH